jgi:sulfate adenylyltransferase
MTDNLNVPHGGELVDLMVGGERRTELLHLSRDWPSWTLTPRQLCDLEMMMSGAFSPLRGFMTRAEHTAVCDTMRLPDGTLWPIPITLDLNEEAAENLSPGSKLALRDVEGVMIGVLHVEDVWEHDREHDATTVYGTTDQAHPGVAHLYQRTNNISVGGRVEGVNRPAHYDFPTLRHTPAELREELSKLGWRNAVAFQTRNPMHRAHYEITLRAAREREANLLIHPVVGMTKPGDLDHYTRVRCYQKLTRHYPKNTAYLSLLPLAMRMAGPREAVWHAIIRKNHGCTHFIVGRDHAGPGNDSKGNPFYGPYDAQELLRKHQDELEIEMVPFQMMVYVEDRATYEPVDQIEPGARTLNISGTELRRRLAEGLDIPEWFTFPEVAEELRKTHPPRARQGFTVFFTGLSGAGKSTIAARCWSSCWRWAAARSRCSTATSCAPTCPRSSASPRSTATSTSSASASSPPRSPRTAASRSARRSPRIGVRREVRELIEPLGGFVCVSSPRRSRSASSATARGCMPRRGPASSRASPASPIPTRSPKTPTW